MFVIVKTEIRRAMVRAKFTGWVLRADPNNYQILFAIAACAFLVALGTIQLLMPRHVPSTA